jgi:hypothetical protein
LEFLPVDDLYGPFADDYAISVTRRRLLGAFLLFAATIAALPNPFSAEFSSEFGAGPGLRCDTSSLPGAPKIRIQPGGMSIDPAGG